MSQQPGRQLLADRETLGHGVTKRLFSSAEIYAQQNFAENTVDYTAYQGSSDWNCDFTQKLSTTNARSPTPTLTFGQRMGQSSLANDIEWSEKKQACTSYPIAIQQYVEATGVSIGAENLVLF